MNLRIFKVLLYSFDYHSDPQNRGCWPWSSSRSSNNWSGVNFTIVLHVQISEGLQILAHQASDYIRLGWKAPQNNRFRQLTLFSHHQCIILGNFTFPGSVVEAWASSAWSPPPSPQQQQQQQQKQQQQQMLPTLASMAVMSILCPGGMKRCTWSTWRNAPPTLVKSPTQELMR